MGELFKKFLFAIIGLVIMLAWWTIRGPSKDPNHTYADEIPAQFWEGGENVLSIEASTSAKAQMRVSLEAPLPIEPNDSDKTRWHEAHQEVAPGQYQWQIRFPKNTRFGTVEWGAKEPKVGDSLQWVVKLNDKIIQEDQSKLEKPLGDGYAMFLQVELEEFFERPIEPVGESTSEPADGEAEPDNAQE